MKKRKSKVPNSAPKAIGGKVNKSFIAFSLVVVAVVAVSSFFVYQAVDLATSARVDTSGFLNKMAMQVGAGQDVSNLPETGGSNYQNNTVVKSNPGLTLENSVQFQYYPKDSVLQVGKTYDFDVVVNPNTSYTKGIFGAQISFYFPQDLVKIGDVKFKDVSPFTYWGFPPNVNGNGRFQSVVFTKDAYSSDRGKSVKEGSIVYSFQLTPLKAGDVLLKFNKENLYEMDYWGKRTVLDESMVAAINADYSAVALPVNFIDLSISAR